MATSVAFRVFFFILLALPSFAIHREVTPIIDFEVFATKLSSAVSHLPYDYSSLKRCPSASARTDIDQQPWFLSLGRQLQGERTRLTRYELKMGVDEVCKQVCDLPYNVEEQSEITKLVRAGYKSYYVLDNMPAVWQEDCYEDFCRSMGVPIGYVDTSNNTCLYNHLGFTVEYNKPADNDYHKRVVGFRVHPFSVAHDLKPNYPNEFTTCPRVLKTAAPMCFEANRWKSVVWTYDVEYNASPIRWATRWDPLVDSGRDDGIRDIQWYSLGYSLLIALGMAVVATRFLRKTLYLDVTRADNGDAEVFLRQAAGWRAIAGDVFRPPRRTGTLCVLVGSGAQILCMAAATLILASVGLLSPINRGALITAMLLLWVLASPECGYCAARLYTSLQGSKSTSVTLGSAFVFSGIAFSVFITLNFVLCASGSTGAVPFTALLVRLFLWLGISVPLNVLGAHIGYKQPAYEYPGRTNRIPREIPTAVKRTTICWSLFGGMAPFVAILVELALVVLSFYDIESLYFFEFLPAAYGILVVTCGLVSVILTSQHLSKESYDWWWPSFLTAASSGGFVFVYSLFVAHLRISGDIRMVSILLRTGYSAIFSLAFALAAGCIGFCA